MDDHETMAVGPDKTAWLFTASWINSYGGTAVEGANGVNLLTIEGYRTAVPGDTIWRSGSEFAIIREEGEAVNIADVTVGQLVGNPTLLGPLLGSTIEVLSKVSLACEQLGRQEPDRDVRDAWMFAHGMVAASAAVLDVWAQSNRRAQRQGFNPADFDPSLN